MTGIVDDVIADYDQLIAREGQFEETLAALDSPYFAFGTTPVLNVLRPYFVARDTYLDVERAANLVHGAIKTVIRRAHELPGLWRDLELTELDEAAMALPHGFAQPDTIGRLDGFLGPDGVVKFVEYNADSPAGIAQGGVLTERFWGSPILRRLGETYQLAAHRPRELAHQALTRAYREWGGRDVAGIAIVDWSGVGTYRDFHAFQDFFERKGHRVVIATPESLEIRNDKLYAGGFQVDLLYKRALISELVARFGLSHPLCDAIRRRVACVSNAFAADVLSRKLIFAILTDPRFDFLFSAEQRAAIARHVPWTRKLRDGRTDYHGKDVDLLPLVAARQAALVIKPNASYGGEGVVLGAKCSTSEWAAAIERGSERTMVVQDRVALRTERVPLRAHGALAFQDRYSDLSPYVWSGERCEGCGVRFSASPILNVAAGTGSIGAMFVVDGRRSERSIA